MCDWVLIGLRWLVGLDLQALLGLDLVPNKVVEMISCTSGSKLLALLWGQTPRLDSGVRVRKHVVRRAAKDGSASILLCSGRGQHDAGLSSIDDIKSTLTQSALDALCEKFHIPNTVHPELPGHNNWIRNSPTDKIGVFTRFFDVANYRIPLSQFLVDVLEYFQINLSQLSVFSAAKVSHFEILCRVHGFVLTVGNFLCDFLANHPAPFWKFPESFLCLIGISRYYELDDSVYPVFLVDDDEEMDLFAFINHADPTKNDDVEDAGNQNDDVQDAGNNVTKEGAADGQEIPVEAEIVCIEDEVLPTVAEKAKGSRKKKKAAGGTSGSSLSPKKLRADHGASSASSSTGGKSVVVLQGLLECNTLPVKVGVTAVATLPFITSSHPVERFVVLSDSPCHSSSNAADAEVSSIVKSLIPDPPIMTTAIATTVVAAASSIPVPRAGDEPVHASIFADSTFAGMVGPDIAGPSQPAGMELSTDTFYSALDDPDVCRNLVDKLAPPVLFSQLHGMDYDQLFAKFNVGVARHTCLGVEVRMRTEHILREKKKLEGRCSRQADLLKERDVEIVSLRAQLALKEAEAAEAMLIPI
ncbi:hypothetical protein Tco_0006712 [Tanacetum coccineum]